MHWIFALTLATQVSVAADASLDTVWPIPVSYAARATIADPADSLLRAATERMSRGDYRGAAE